MRINNLEVPNFRRHYTRMLSAAYAGSCLYVPCFSSWDACLNDFMSLKRIMEKM